MTDDYEINLESLRLSAEAIRIAKKIRERFVYGETLKGNPYWCWSIRPYGYAAAFHELHTAGLVDFQTHNGDYRKTHFQPLGALLKKRDSQLDIDRREIARLQARGYVIGIALEGDKPE